MNAQKKLDGSSAIAPSPVATSSALQTFKDLRPELG
jgi:hypothetical protein